MCVFLWAEIAQFLLDVSILAKFSQLLQEKVVVLGLCDQPNGAHHQGHGLAKVHFKGSYLFASFCAMWLWDTILENLQQSQQQSRAGFFNFGFQPEIMGGNWCFQNFCIKYTQCYFLIGGPPEALSHRLWQPWGSQIKKMSIFASNRL